MFYGCYDKSTLALSLVTQRLPFPEWHSSLIKSIPFAFLDNQDFLNQPAQIPIPTSQLPSFSNLQNSLCQPINTIPFPNQLIPFPLPKIQHPFLPKHRPTQSSPLSTHIRPPSDKTFPLPNLHFPISNQTPFPLPNPHFNLLHTVQCHTTPPLHSLPPTSISLCVLS